MSQVNVHMSEQVSIISYYRFKDLKYMPIQ